MAVQRRRTPRPSLYQPWRSDFSVVPAEARRAARYALQLVSGRPESLKRMDDSDFTGALWTLCLPLLEPSILSSLQAAWNDKGDDDPSNDDEDGDHLEFDCDDLPDFLCGRSQGRVDQKYSRQVRSYLNRILRPVPDAVLTRLAQQDGLTPIYPGIAALSRCASLSDHEVMVLDFAGTRGQHLPFATFLRELRSQGLRTNLDYLSAALAMPLEHLKPVLSQRGTLRQLALLRPARSRDDLEDCVAPDDLLTEILVTAPEDEEALMAMIVAPTMPASWKLDDFPHLQHDALRLRVALSHAAMHQVDGVNALLYGPPGTGKTEFALALAREANLTAYQVKTADEDGEGLTRRGRLAAFQLLQRLLQGRRDCVVLFDEVEDAFGGNDNVLLALLGKRSGGGHGDKGWMNRSLESNPVPAIWITNDVESMDPAFLRRFLLPVAFTTPPRSVRRRMAERHLGNHQLPPALLDELADDAALTPAQLGAAARLLTLYQDDDPARTVREGVAASRRLLIGSATPRLRQSPTAFDAAFLNLAGGIAPDRIADALLRTGQGRLCFYGPPGTGKTEFAHLLADVLQRELIVRSTSDIVSKYVGETEKNVAALFNDLDTERSILFLDEVDSLLLDRRQARHSWETTQVNELLQRIEQFPGIFVAATNLMDGLDAAALRRFDFKLHFRPLTQAQRLALFAREVLGDANRYPDIPTAIAQHLKSMDGLTAGDFANVVRQGRLLGDTLGPEAFLRRLMGEHRWKGATAQRSVTA